MLNKKDIITYAVVIAVGIILGLWMAHCSRKPVEPVKVERDTVVVRDTVFDYQPAPIDSAMVRYVTRCLPVVRHDTVTRDVDHFRDLTKMVQDTVEVEIPITSKHYFAKDYDAWVSGYEPSLDSIKVYHEKQYITETITRTIKDNKHFFLDVGAGCEYQFNGKTAVPFAEFGARLKFGKVSIGAYGGYSHDLKDNKASPQARIKVSYDILGF